MLSILWIQICVVQRVSRAVHFSLPITFKPWANLLSEFYISNAGESTPILYYATETKDFEYSDCFTSSCLAERKETILDTAQYIFKVHKVRYSRLILSPSYSYITKYKSRIRQICTATRFCKSDIIWTMCPRSFIPISKIPFSF